MTMRYELILLLFFVPGITHAYWIDVEEIYRYTNEARQEVGVRALVPAEALRKSAQEKAEALVTLDYFGHIPPGEPTWTKELIANYQFTYAGENLARVGLSVAGTSSWDEERLQKGWFDSEGHRKNILKPEYREYGVGIAASGKYEVIVVHFATPVIKEPIWSSQSLDPPTINPPAFARIGNISNTRQSSYENWCAVVSSTGTTNQHTQSLTRRFRTLLSTFLSSMRSWGEAF